MINMEIMENGQHRHCKANNESMSIISDLKYTIQARRQLPHYHSLPHIPGSVAEMRLPKRREGMADLVKPSGMGRPVLLANQESSVSAPLTE